MALFPSFLKCVSFSFSFVQDRVSELESNLQDLQNQLQEQEEEANGVIEQWQESCNAAEEKASRCERDLEASLNAKQELENTVATLEADASMFEIEKATLEDQIVSLEKALAVSKSKVSSDTPEQLGRQNRNWEELVAAEDELSRSKDAITQLQGRLFISIIL